MKTYDVPKWVEMYESGQTISQIALNYGVCSKTISDKVRLKVPIRKAASWLQKYTCDASVFDKINSQESAYWLGFMLADGCLTKQRTVNLLLNQKDADHISKFKDFLKSTNPIEYRKDIQNNKLQETAKIRIRDEKLFTNLEKLGCGRLKTHSVVFPDSSTIPDQYIVDFIRGYFDGDGSIWHCQSFHKKAKKFYVKVGASFTGTNAFIDSLYSILGKYNLTCSLQDHKSVGFKILNISSLKDLKNLEKLFYDQATIFLERKRQKFLELPDTNTFLKREEKEQIILDYIKNNPESCCDEISRDTNIPLLMAHIITKKNKDNGLLKCVTKSIKKYYSYQL